MPEKRSFICVGCGERKDGVRCVAATGVRRQHVRHDHDGRNDGRPYFCMGCADGIDDIIFRKHGVFLDMLWEELDRRSVVLDEDIPAIYERACGSGTFKNKYFTKYGKSCILNALQISNTMGPVRMWKRQ
jgi:hypothetical protein